MRYNKPVRRQAKRGRGTAQGGVRFVYCPKCGDPVAGRLTKQLTCVHCKETFALDESQVQTGIVWYNASTRRWQVG
jgi:ribosomal protein L37AE/L43A